MEKMIAVDEEKYVRAVALLADIHRHLKAGNSIHPSAVEVLNPDPDTFTKEHAPTITEYIGGVLDELKAGK